MVFRSWVKPAGDPAWQPTAPLEHLRKRGEMLSRIRAFFEERQILEVETPILSSYAAAERHIEPLTTRFQPPNAPPLPLYLHTSPEMGMKRLLAAGSGPIYQICRVFRDGEEGPLHNPEFTLLEWYRPGFDQSALMAEIADLLALLLGRSPTMAITFQEAYRQHAGVDPFADSLDDLKQAAARNNGEIPPGLDRDGLLDLLLATVVGPALGHDKPCFLTAFPASQAAMAKLDQGPPATARRFELFVDGIEIANGYEELSDAVEQKKRFRAENRERVERGMPFLPDDPRFLTALEMAPDCSGVAMGVDRLLLLILGVRDLSQVMAFPFSRA